MQISQVLVGEGGNLFVLLSEIEKLHGRDTSEKLFVLSNS